MALAQDVDIKATGYLDAGDVTTAQFSTSSGGQLLVAFVSSNVTSDGASITVSGAGLSWTKRVEHKHSSYGTAQVWTAWASSQLTNVTVSAHLTGTADYHATLLHVVSFTDASDGVGATATPTEKSGSSDSNNITTTVDNSWIWGVGEDWEAGNHTRVANSNQTIAQSYYETTDGSSHWIQKQNSTTPTSGTSVPIGASVSGHTDAKWLWILVEIKPASTTDRRGQISWGELETPTAPRRGKISWTEMESPLPPRRGLISWAELEAPTAPRRVLISWSEEEVPTAPRRGFVSWTELEVPSLVAEYRALVSWAEMEVPLAPRRGLVSWTELEVPLGQRRAEVSWVEMQFPQSSRFILSWCELEISTWQAGTGFLREVVRFLFRRGR